MYQYNCTLLIDDDYISNFLHDAILRKHKICENIEIRGNGETALLFLDEYYEKHNSLPELILLDIKMPVMNGFEFLEAYEKYPVQVRDRTNVIVVSTLCPSDIKVLTLNNTLYLSKPLKSKDLIALLTKKTIV